MSGAKLLSFFGDAATEILIRHDQDEGLFVAYDQVQFLAPVYVGDYLEITAQLDRVGNTSRGLSFNAYKTIAHGQDPQKPYKAALLDTPMLVAKASGTCVVPNR